MIDQVFIQVFTGKGGNGSVSGRREKFVPLGGPDGGDGGSGGSVYMTSDPNVNTLLSFRYNRRFVAGNGGDGERRLRHGKNGEDVSIIVPVGTMIWSEDAPQRLIADLSEPGQRVQLGRGGSGGKGNTRFASPTNQFPLLAEEGEDGEELNLRLELKLLADVGIIGVPNAGKSSLLASASAAKPKIADYPFTTLEPVLGVLERRHETFVLVDIPGLIEGASDGIGLGHDFLRHIERTRVLIHMLDGSSDNPIRDYHQINQELGQFNEDLMTKPQIIAINKIDLPDVRDYIELFEEELADEEAPLFFVSAATTEGVGALLDKVIQVLAETKETQSVNQEDIAIEDIPVLRPQPRRQGVKVYKEDEIFVVEAPRAARIGARIDTNDWATRIQYYGYLRRTGVVLALEQAGILPGDSVRIGKLEWEWE